MGSEPDADATEVPRHPRLVLQLDRRVLPRTVNRGTVQVESGAVSEFLFVRFEPVRRQILAETHPDAPLSAWTSYLLRVDGLQDLDRLEQPERFEIRFRTGDDLSRPAAGPSPGWAEVASLFGGRCALAGCHGAQQPALGLDLSSAEGVRQTAIGVPSEHALDGPGETGALGARTLVDLKRIDVAADRGDPALSYLVYKVTGDPHIMGDPMPPGDPLSSADQQLLSDWIAAGAPTW